MAGPVPASFVVMVVLTNRIREGTPALELVPRRNCARVPVPGIDSEQFVNVIFAPLVVDAMMKSFVLLFPLLVDSVSPKNRNVQAFVLAIVKAATLVPVVVEAPASQAPVDRLTLIIAIFALAVATFQVTAAPGLPA